MTAVAIEHPARHYILYLLSRRQYQVRDIFIRLMEQNFAMPEMEHEVLSLHRQIEKVRDELIFPPGYDPTDLSHRGTAEFLRKHRIYDMWAMGPDIVSALDVLDTPSLRREVEIMLLGPLRYGDIAKRLLEFHGFELSQMNMSTIRAYAHYFWDIEGMPHTRWHDFLDNIKTGADYLVAYKAPRSQVGAALSIYLATRGGVGTPKEQIMFRHVRDNCFAEFLKVSSLRFPGMQKSASMQGLVSALIQAQEQVDMRRGGSSEVLEELRRLESRFDDRPLTSAAELPLHYVPANIEEAKDKEGAS